MNLIPLHPIHVALGAKMVPFAGFQMPVRYTSDIEEHLCVRNNVGLFDVSHMGEFLVSGEHALAFLQKVTTNDVANLVPGKAQYTCFTNYDGGIIDDLLVYKLADHEYMLVVNASNIAKNWEWLTRHNIESAVINNISDTVCLFALQGPYAASCLQKICSYPINTIKYYEFVYSKVHTIDTILISHTGYTGAGGFELYVPNQHALELWNALILAGAEFGIKPIGLGARDTLRLEMGYCLYGNDLSDKTTPIEAGLSWITKFTKNFIGSEILKKQKNEGVDQKLIGFVLLDRAIPRKGYDICDENNVKIGEVTSGSQSPVLSKGIGLGYVKESYSQPYTPIFIKIREQLVPAQITTLPFVTTHYKA